MKKADYSKIAETYDISRKISRMNIELWLDPVYDICDKHEKIADIGCGTGRFTIPLAYNYDFIVTGIDKSEEMLLKARGKDTENKINWQILDVDTITDVVPQYNCIFMSHLLHHISDKSSFLTHCYNLLFQNGKIFIRHGSMEQIEHDVEHSFFPAALEIDKQRTLRTGQLEELLYKTGFKRIRTLKKKQKTYKDVEDHYNRIAMKFSSVLTLIPENDFKKGLKKLRKFLNDNPGNKWLLEDEMSLTIGYKEK